MRRFYYYIDLTLGLRMLLATKGVLIFLLVGLMGCRSQQTIQVLSYAQGRELGEEYVRHYNPRKKSPYWPVHLVGPPASAVHLRRTDRSKKALVLGRVALQREDGTRLPQPGGIVSIDGIPTFADEAGNYRREVAPGRHTTRAGGIGFLWSAATTLRVKQGDSIRINFNLLPEFRPIIH